LNVAAREAVNVADSPAPSRSDSGVMRNGCEGPIGSPPLGFTGGGALELLQPLVERASKRISQDLCERTIMTSGSLRCKIIL
jgi:hypothetical protein